MRFPIFVVLSLLCCTFLTSQAFPSLNEIDVTKAVNFYNSIPGTTWKAGINGFYGKVKLSEIKSKLGLIFKNLKKKAQNSKSNSSSNDDSSKTIQLPLEYDARKAYPESSTISSIKDQSNCGSCWAVCTAAAFSDRLYIASGGRVNYNMSAEQLLSCSEEDYGCDGGTLETAWKYIEKNGLVTGGDYGSKEGCQPYSIPPNNSNPARTPTCSKASCPIMYKATNIRELPTKEDEIREEIYRNGPVSASLVVYLSFLFYEEGIYSKFFIDFPLGGHGVRIIGWGEEKGRKYWIIANSWGTKWGEQGTFRILRGTNHCGIESNVVVGRPKLE